MRTISKLWKNAMKYVREYQTDGLLKMVKLYIQWLTEAFEQIQQT